MESSASNLLWGIYTPPCDGGSTPGFQSVWTDFGSGPEVWAKDVYSQPSANETKGQSHARDCLFPCGRHRRRMGTETAAVDSAQKKHWIAHSLLARGKGKVQLEGFCLKI